MFAVAHPFAQHKDYPHSSSRLGEAAESASLGPWRHVGGRGGEEVVSALVVGGRRRVAFPMLCKSIKKDGVT